MIIGYDIANVKYQIINILLNFAQYVIYKMYLLKMYDNKKIYTRKLFIEFKSIMRSYFRVKINQKHLNMTEIDKILLIL